jgi:hypothetical protein
VIVSGVGRSPVMASVTPFVFLSYIVVIIGSSHRIDVKGF